MKIKIPYKSVVVSSVFLGVLISLQFKTINLENEGMTTSKKGEQLLIELKSLKKESNSLKEQINTIKREIDKYKEDEGDDILKSEIQKRIICLSHKQNKAHSKSDNNQNRLRYCRKYL